MLGKTACGLFWMSRQLERSENTARLVEAGFRMALTHSSATGQEWMSILQTAGCSEQYTQLHDEISQQTAIDFLLRNRDNPSSVASLFWGARQNARMVRAALTREVWESVNEGWLILKDQLKRPVKEADLPELLAQIRQQSALVRGAAHGSLMHDDGFCFARLGTFIERADNTARILDVKYYVLLPAVTFVGSALDNIQWETVLRSASAERAYTWLYGGETRPSDIADFLILDRRMPRSLNFCIREVVHYLTQISVEYGVRRPSVLLAERLQAGLGNQRIDDIFEAGLHEFIADFLTHNNQLAAQIEADFRFYE